MNTFLSKAGNVSIKPSVVIRSFPMYVVRYHESFLVLVPLHFPYRLTNGRRSTYIIHIQYRCSIITGLCLR